MHAVIPAPGTYVVDPALSGISFTVRHRFGLGTVRGSFGVSSGTITIGEPLAKSEASAAADATTFRTGHRGRDSTVLSPVFLDAEHYPEITFQSTGAFQSAGGQWRLRGTVTARGVCASAEFAVTEAMLADDDGLVLTATATVDRYAHGITAMKGLAGRYVRLTAQIHAFRGPRR